MNAVHDPQDRKPTAVQLPVDAELDGTNEPLTVEPVAPGATDTLLIVPAAWIGYNIAPNDRKAGERATALPSMAETLAKL